MKQLNVLIILNIALLIAMASCSKHYLGTYSSGEARSSPASFVKQIIILEENWRFKRLETRVEIDSLDVVYRTRTEYKGHFELKGKKLKLIPNRMRQSNDTLFLYEKESVVFSSISETTKSDFINYTPKIYSYFKPNDLVLSRRKSVYILSRIDTGNGFYKIKHVSDSTFPKILTLTMD